jgi:hypothetical protein
MERSDHISARWFEGGAINRTVSRSARLAGLRSLSSYAQGSAGKPEKAEFNDQGEPVAASQSECETQETVNASGKAFLPEQNIREKH